MESKAIANSCEMSLQMHETAVTNSFAVRQLKKYARKWNGSLSYSAEIAINVVCQLSHEWSSL